VLLWGRLYAPTDCAQLPAAAVCVQSEARGEQIDIINLDCWTCGVLRGLFQKIWVLIMTYCDEKLIALTAVTWCMFFTQTKLVLSVAAGTECCTPYSLTSYIRKVDMQLT